MRGGPSHHRRNGDHDDRISRENMTVAITPSEMIIAIATGTSTTSVTRKPRLRGGSRSTAPAQRQKPKVTVASRIRLIHNKAAPPVGKANRSGNKAMPTRGRRGTRKGVATRMALPLTRGRMRISTKSTRAGAITVTRLSTPGGTGDKSMSVAYCFWARGLAGQCPCVLFSPPQLRRETAVSYTHLTLPTILLV